MRSSIVGRDLSAARSVEIAPRTCVWIVASNEAIIETPDIWSVYRIDTSEGLETLIRDVSTIIRAHGIRRAAQRDSLPAREKPIGPAPSAEELLENFLEIIGSGD